MCASLAAAKQLQIHPRCRCPPRAGGSGRAKPRRGFCRHVWMEALGTLANAEISLVKKKNNQQPNPKCNQEMFPHLSFFFFFFPPKEINQVRPLSKGCFVMSVGEFGEISGVGRMGRNMAPSLCLVRVHPHLLFFPSLQMERAGRGSCHRPCAARQSHQTAADAPWPRQRGKSSALGAGASRCHDPIGFLGTAVWLCAGTPRAGAVAALHPAAPRCRGARGGTPQNTPVPTGAAPMGGERTKIPPSLALLGGGVGVEE